MDKQTKENIKEYRSKVAASKAFWQTALTRVLIPIPSTHYLNNIFFNKKIK